MGLQRTVLPSGVRVVTHRMPGQVAASLGAWVSVGSRHEPAELSGVTHFLEHLVFKGTESHNALEIAQMFDAIGGDINAFTTKELTCFYTRTLAADAPLGLRTIAELARRALLRFEDVEAERSVVLEEIAMHEDTPDDIVFDQFQETLWDGDALGRRVQGYAETVRTMTRDQIAEHYLTQYADIVVAAAGDVHHDQVVELAAASLGGVLPPAPERSVPMPAAHGALSVRVRDIEQSHLVYGTTGIPRDDPRRWALGLLSVALGEGMSSRLFQEIRERRGLAYAVSSGIHGFSDTGLFQIYAGCSPENAAEVLKVAREHVTAVAEGGLNDEEHARAVGHLRGSLLLSLDDPGALMTHIGRSELVEHEILTSDQMLNKIESVTSEELRAVARQVLGTGPWSLAVLGPQVPADLSGFVGDAA